MRRCVRPLVALVLASATMAVTPAWSASANRSGESKMPEVPASSRLIVTHDVRFGTDHGQALLLDIYQPSGGNRPAMILIHGGGFRGGDKSEDVTAANTFADAGYVVFVPNYLLAPDYPFPAAVDDVEQAAAWVKAHAAAYGADSKRIASFGLSSGGNLAAVLAVKRDVNVGASWSGPLDLLAMGGPAEYVPTHEDKIAASATTYVNAGDPPLLIANSVDEHVPLSQATEMARLLSTAGVPYELDKIQIHAHAWAYHDIETKPTLQFLARYVGPVPPVPIAMMSTKRVAAGERDIFQGWGYLPGELVSASFPGGSPRTGTADGTGAVSIELTSPPEAWPGGVVSGVSGSGTATADFLTKKVLTAPHSATSGTNVTISVTGFAPNERLTISLDAQSVKTFSSDANGSGSASLRIRGTSGSHTLTVTGPTAGATSVTINLKA